MAVAHHSDSIGESFEHEADASLRVFGQYEYWHVYWLDLHEAVHTIQAASLYSCRECQLGWVDLSTSKSFIREPSHVWLCSNVTLGATWLEYPSVHKVMSSLCLTTKSKEMYWAWRQTSMHSRLKFSWQDRIWSTPVAVEYNNVDKECDVPIFRL
jgi:hypothetical protein